MAYIQTNIKTLNQIWFARERVSGSERANFRSFLSAGYTKCAQMTATELGIQYPLVEGVMEAEGLSQKPGSPISPSIEPPTAETLPLYPSSQENLPSSQFEAPQISKEREENRIHLQTVSIRS